MTDGKQLTAAGGQQVLLQMEGFELKLSFGRAWLGEGVQGVNAAGGQAFMV
jgi:hypothetical protein